MNVTFRLPSEELEKAFLKEAQAQELDGLKGHRSVGGLRASIYNACPIESVRGARRLHGRVPGAARLTLLTGPALRGLGFDGFFEESFAPLAARGLVPGRVVAGHARVLRVHTEEGEAVAAVTGRLRHEARGPSGLPTVGDWVALRPFEAGQRAVIEALLPRRTAFVRRAPGDRSVAQVLAANVDTVFLVMGLDGDFNPRRIERALVLAWESGALPVVLLNKADLCADLDARRARDREGRPRRAGARDRGQARARGWKRSCRGSRPAARSRSWAPPASASPPWSTGSWAARSRRRARCARPTSAADTRRPTAS